MGKTSLISNLLQNISLNQIRKKLNNPRLWRDSSLLILANIIVTLLGLIRTPAMTWMLPKEEYGMIAAVTAWTPFLQLFSIVGLDTASYHYTAKGKPWAFIISIKKRLRWSIVSCLGFIILAFYWFIKNNSLLAWLFLITGVLYPVTTGLSGIPGMLSGQEKFRNLFWYRVFESLCLFVGFIPIALSSWIRSRVVVFYFSNQVAAMVLQIIYMYFIYTNLSKDESPPLSQEDEVELIRYGKHQTVITGISVVQSRIDIILVSVLLSQSVMADYNIGMIVADQFKKLWNIFVSIRYPPLVKMDLPRRRKRFLLEGSVIVIIFIFLGIIVSYLGHFLIPILLPASYISSLTYMDILIGAVIIGTPGGIIEMYYRSRQNEKMQYLMRIISATVSVIASLVFVIFMGGKGAAYGRLFANLVFSIFGICLFITKK